MRRWHTKLSVFSHFFSVIEELGQFGQTCLTVQNNSPKFINRDTTKVISCGELMESVAADGNILRLRKYKEVMTFM
jgi:hypothetical protein